MNIGNTKFYAVALYFKHLVRIEDIVSSSGALKFWRLAQLNTHCMVKPIVMKEYKRSRAKLTSVNLILAINTFYMIFPEGLLNRLKLS